MKKILLFVSIFPFFIFVYFAQQELLVLFKVKNIELAQNFYRFISMVAMFMLLNLVLMHYFKQRYTGFVFLAWSMLKIMLVMGYFVYFVLIPGKNLSNAVIFDMVGIYLLYLIYEVVFGIFLIRDTNVITGK
jgi:hypothetical protein